MLPKSGESRGTASCAVDFITQKQVRLFTLPLEAGNDTIILFSILFICK